MAGKDGRITVCSSSVHMRRPLCTACRLMLHPDVHHVLCRAKKFIVVADYRKNSKLLGQQVGYSHTAHSILVSSMFYLAHAWCVLCVSCSVEAGHPCGGALHGICISHAGDGATEWKAHFAYGSEEGQHDSHFTACIAVSMTPMRMRCPHDH